MKRFKKYEKMSDEELMSEYNYVWRLSITARTAKENVAYQKQLEKIKYEIDLRNL